MNYYLSLYRRFACLAGKCPSTCCAGWKILVDKVSVKRFAALESEALREDILSHLTQEHDNYYFKHRTDGSCAMLDQDGLCRIQRNLDEPSLCITCRKYPRIAGKVEGNLWMSMAASCPVVADYLWKEPIAWLVAEEGKKAHSVSIEEITQNAGSDSGIAKLVEEMKCFLSWFQKTGWHDGKQCVTWYAMALDMAETVSVLLGEYPEQSYFPGSFDYYEQEDLTAEKLLLDMQKYEERFFQCMTRFWDNYIRYRYFSRFLERQEEDGSHRFCQILGELALVDVICFSCFVSRSDWGMEKVPEIICWVYRFCAHGQSLSIRMNQFFYEVFSDDYPCDGKMPE